MRSPARKALIRNFTTPYLTTWEFLTTVKILNTDIPNRAGGIAWDFKDYTSNETMNFQNSATDNVDTEENHMKLAEDAENFVPSDVDYYEANYHFYNIDHISSCDGRATVDIVNDRQDTKEMVHSEGPRDIVEMVSEIRHVDNVMYHADLGLDIMSDEECLCVTADITWAECGDSAVEGTLCKPASMKQADICLHDNSPDGAYSDRHNWTCQNVWWLSLLLHPQLGVG